MPQFEQTTINIKNTSQQIMRKNMLANNNLMSKTQAMNSHTGYQRK